MDNNEVNEILFKINNSSDEDEIVNLKSKLLNIYQNLIVSTTKKYLKNEDDYEDLLQESYLLFLNSIDTYDISKNLKFDDFIYKVLDTKVKESASNFNNNISFSNELTNVLNHILDIEESFLIKNSRYPLDQELEPLLNMTLDDIRKYKMYAIEILSLDKNDLDLIKKPLSILIKESKGKMNDLSDISNENSELLELSLDMLSEKEKDIVIKYYGLKNETKLDIEEISKIYDVSKERIRQVLNLAIKKLKREMNDDEE